VGARLQGASAARRGVIMARMRPRGEDRPRRLAVAAGLLACALALVAAAPAARPGGAAVVVRHAVDTAGGAVVVRDPVDTAGGLDLTRVQLGRAPDGRLRAALTLAAPWRVRDLPADEGPPGSICLRLWKVAEDAPPFPDRLVCITADARGRDLRGSVLVERDGSLQRVAGVALARSSTRTVVARFSQSAIGRPAAVRFAAEATPPGCARPACVDTAPNAPAVATLTLRSR
jgi:hypothetical protein